MLIKINYYSYEFASMRMQNNCMRKENDECCLLENVFGIQSYNFLRIIIVTLGVVIMQMTTSQNDGSDAFIRCIKLDELSHLKAKARNCTFYCKYHVAIHLDFAGNNV